MDPLERLVELKLQDAEERGLLRGLPGAGKPLPPDEFADVPADLRSAWRMLSQAGFVPEEVELRRSNAQLEDLLRVVTDERERQQIQRRLTAQTLRYELLMERRGRTPAAERYRAAVRRRLG